VQTPLSLVRASREWQLVGKMESTSSAIPLPWVGRAACHCSLRSAISPLIGSLLIAHCSKGFGSSLEKDAKVCGCLDLANWRESARARP
jgi:hypothetical protein